MSVLGRIREVFRTEFDQECDYECKECGAGFELLRHVCPHCGSYRVEHARWEE